MSKTLAPVMPTRGSLMLIAPTLFIPYQGNAVLLGTGTILMPRLDLEPLELAPRVAPVADEWRVWRVDATGKRERGWVSGRTLRFKPTPLPTLRFGECRGGEMLHPYDVLRCSIALAGVEADRYIRGMRSPDDITLLRAVVRELGGQSAPPIPIKTLIAAALRLIVRQPPQEKKTMSKTKTADAPETSKKSKLKLVESAPRKNALGVHVGEQLSEALKGIKSADAGLVKAARTLASGGELSKKVLTAVRDGVNALAAAQREKGRTKTASILSGVNRAVRRLARAAS